MDLPSPGIQPRSPALQADSLPAETDYLCKDLVSKQRHILRSWGLRLEHIFQGDTIQPSTLQGKTLGLSEVLLSRPAHILILVPS